MVYGNENYYKFSEGQRVYNSSLDKHGEITASVPGNGTFPWYYVTFEDGTEDRFTDDELEAA